MAVGKDTLEERSFSFPTGVEADKIKASFDHGVLSFKCPKVSRANAQLGL